MLLSTALLLATPALPPLPVPGPLGPQESASRSERTWTTGVAPASNQTLIPLSRALGMGPSAFGFGVRGIPGQGGGLLTGQASSLTVIVNGMVAPAMQVSSGSFQPVSVTPGWTQIALNVPGFTNPELAIVGSPGLPLSAGNRPLIVVCHRFSVSHADVFNTQFLEEAEARGWYLLSPLSRNPVGPGDINYGSEASQLHTYQAIQYMLDTYPIDRSRIYGVGFSMGAAQLMSYAARHQSPKTGMFAALVNHTGSIDQADTWRLEPDSRAVLEDIFDGTPTEQPFAYRNASILEIDELTGTLKVDGTHPGINLSQTPTQLWWAQQDPNQYLVNQTVENQDFLVDVQAPLVEVFPVMVGGHEWDLLSYSDICDWFDQQQLEIPFSGTFLADRDQRWRFFDISGIPAETMASVTYSMDLPNAVVELRETESVEQIETNLRRWNGGSTVALPLTVKLDAIDAGDKVVLRGIVNFPLVVTRDGQPQATGWAYDSIAQTLTITELETGPHAWEFLP